MEKVKGKVYRPALWKRMLAIFPLVAMPLAVIYIMFDFFQRGDGLMMLIGLLFAFSVAFICWYCFEYAFRTCVILSDVGIEGKGVIRAYITWDAVDCFMWNGTYKYRIWGIKTIRPMDYCSGVWGHAKDMDDSFFPLSHVIGRPPHKKVEMLVMEIGVNLDKFAKTPLGQDLLHHAPHLFE